jgi:hypothetical protein
LLVIGLGLLAGAVLHAPLAAQATDTIPKKPDTTAKKPPTRADSLRDSLFRVDSVRRAHIIADSIKAPLAHAEQPQEYSIGRTLHWTRDSLFATGALTLADLLERVPGLSTFRGGWLSAPQVAAYMGDPRRVRVFYDGFDQTVLDPRAGGVLDLTQINLWSVEEAVVEQAADEVRVYLRSWRVRNTHTETRTDVSTGDQQTNLYRAFFGKRLQGGGDFQFGAQQYGTTPPSRFGASSDQTGVVVRAGLARQKWSIDAYGTRVGRHRGTIVGESSFDVAGDSMPQTSSTRTDAYLRGAYGDPDIDRAWAQVMAVASRYTYTGLRTFVGPPGTAAESALVNAPLDTNKFVAQYVASAGTVRGAVRASGTARVFISGGKTIIAPSARAGFSTDHLDLSAFAEGKSVDSIARADVSARLTPLPSISLLGSVARSTDDRKRDSSVSTTYFRGEAGLRVRGLWLIGGVLRRDSVRIAPAREFDTSFVLQRAKPATGIEGAIRGKLWRFVNADITGIRWSDSTGAYRPQYQTRSELFIRTNLIEHFPSNNFGLMASLIHEYRSDAHFPSLTSSSQPPIATGCRTVSSLLEIRIQSATISWQFRNVLGERYSQIGGFIMPRQTNFYGVRWTFAD